MAFFYPMDAESKVGFFIPAQENLVIRVWELRLETNQKFKLPAEAGAGYLAVVWSGGVACNGAPLVKSGVELTESDVLTLAEGVSAASLAIFGILDPKRRNPDLELPARDTCGDDVIQMPRVLNSQRLTAYIRTLDLDEGGPISLESWHRPGFVLTSPMGPWAGALCDPGSSTSSDYELYLLPIDDEFKMDLRNSSTTLALICDFYARTDGQPDRKREGSPEGGGEGGCKLRCWS